MNSIFAKVGTLIHHLPLCLALLCSSALLAEESFNQLPQEEQTAEQIAAQGPAKTILLLGESLSSDYRVNHDDSWTVQLETHIKEELPGWTLVNGSMPSNTVRNAMRQVEYQLKEHTPALVLVQLGNNDALRANAVRHIQEDLVKLIAKIKKSNIQVMIIGSSITEDLGENYSKRFLAMHQKLALSEATGLVPDLLEKVSSDKTKLTADGIHANSEGHKQMLENAWLPIRDYVQCVETSEATGTNCAFTLPEEEAEEAHTAEKKKKAKRLRATRPARTD